MNSISILEGRVNRLMLDAESEASHLRNMCSGEYQNRDFETHIIEGSGHVVQLDFRSGEVKTYFILLCDFKVFNDFRHRFYGFAHQFDFCPVIRTVNEGVYVSVPKRSE